jgi:hypothetical protein
VLVGVLVTLAGCGGDGESSAPDSQARERPAAEESAAPHEEQAAAADSDRDCLELWNADVAPGTVGQKSSSDFVVDIASKQRVNALARFADGYCLVVVPFEPDAKAAWAFVAANGRAPYGHPSQLRLPRGRVFAFNARTNPDGTLE